MEAQTEAAGGLQEERHGHHKHKKNQARFHKTESYCLIIFFLNRLLCTNLCTTQFSPLYQQTVSTIWTSVSFFFSSLNILELGGTRNSSSSRLAIREGGGGRGPRTETYCNYTRRKSVRRKYSARPCCLGRWMGGGRRRRRTSLHASAASSLSPHSGRREGREREREIGRRTA